MPHRRASKIHHGDSWVLRYDWDKLRPAAHHQGDDVTVSTK
jgi:hypothetical protein